ncbi:unnamed protein product [Adineta steineri]|uniref:Uncharacterized protein n=1 Tax=Adineta steineri TaxID=433720 RepID=A0A815PXE9_9BILA|nr:unnamed protein product [Adineta steineri]CAF3885768.1 unnamed protein product [Adineta steineri]
MISIFICLLFVGTSDASSLPSQRAAPCSWAGHCAGDACFTYNDCDGSLVCTNGKCSNSDGFVEPCSWNGHCIGDPCNTYNDCDGSLICSNGKCSNGNTGGGSTQDTTCKSSGVLYGVASACVTDNMSTCCKVGVSYPQYKCSPSSKSSAVLTLNSFQKGGDGGGAGACFGLFYPDAQQVVALSTGWYNKGSRCGKMITIYGNGKTTKAMVVDECDSVHGCDKMHAGQPPCRNNVVDGSPAVWAALGISKSDPRYGQISISWSD